MRSWHTCHTHRRLLRRWPQEQLALEDVGDVEALLEAELLEQQLAPGLAAKLARFEAELEDDE